MLITPSTPRRSPRTWHVLLIIICLLKGTGFVGAATFTVTNTADAGPGSLREAISNVNSSAGSNTILFQIAGKGPFTIMPTSALPILTNSIVLDATSQPGYAGTPMVEINGSQTPDATPGLHLTGGFSVVRGLAINRFPAQAVILEGVSNVVQGNFLGTDATGAIARGNGSYGIWIMGAGNLIGGTNAGDGNVISGGNDTGIYVSGGGGNLVQGNLIGVTAAGTARLGNAKNGIVLDGSNGNVVGGISEGARNVISGNGISGIYLNGTSATSNRIEGNYIGTDTSGTLVISNSGDGITINGAPENSIGGSVAAAGNLISGNALSGISVIGSGAVGNRIQANLIGTDATGEQAAGNHIAGITVFRGVSTLIGGTDSNEGNVISGNTQDGVFLTRDTFETLVQGNRIGLSANGTLPIPNGYNGISINGGSSNWIGGATIRARNIISGNVYNGVGIMGRADQANVISGNYIGTDVSGSNAIPNLLSGVRLEAPSNHVGGIAAGTGNLISANGEMGVWLVGKSAKGNQISGNIIGLDGNGNALGNGGAGIGLSSADGNRIGGNTPHARNIISGNHDAGIFLVGAGSTNNLVQGNFIGTDGTGFAGRGNVYEGIYLQDGDRNQIGGTATGEGNLISGNHTRGVWLTNASWNVIQGNYIGTAADGDNPLGNAFFGIELDSDALNNAIGGDAIGAANRIAFAQTVYAGVRVRDGSRNNLISGNAIFDNGGLGIDLGAYGANDVVACQTGVGSSAANRSQNFPELADAISGNVTRVQGTFDSIPGKTYVIEFFASATGDPSGFGEGQLYLGQTTLSLVGSCVTNFTALLARPLPPGWIVSATATDPDGNTSEFSRWIGANSLPTIQSSLDAANGQFSVWWTNTEPGLVLQQAHTLTPPITWTRVTNVISSGNLFHATIPSTDTNSFFRLVSP